MDGQTQKETCCDKFLIVFYTHKNGAVQNGPRLHYMQTRRHEFAVRKRTRANEHRRQYTSAAHDHHDGKFGKLRFIIDRRWLNAVASIVRCRALPHWTDSRATTSTADSATPSPGPTSTADSTWVDTWKGFILQPNLHPATRPSWRCDRMRRFAA